MPWACPRIAYSSSTRKMPSIRVAPLYPVTDHPKADSDDHFKTGRLSLVPAPAPAHVGNHWRRPS